jgi:hypothetical protein
MWPIQFAFRLRISCRIFLCSLTLYHSHTHTHTHTHTRTRTRTVRLPWASYQLVAKTAAGTKHNKQKPTAGFEPAVSVIERL